VARNLEQVRDRAEGLYDALDLGYCCEREHSHLANLRLEFRRGSAGGLAYESHGGGLRFKFLFCYAPTDGSASLSGCREAELKPLDYDGDNSSIDHSIDERPVGQSKLSAPRGTTYVTLSKSKRSLHSNITGLRLEPQCLCLRAMELRSPWNVKTYLPRLAS
jgi:hypothetical protein